MSAGATARPGQTSGMAFYPHVWCFGVPLRGLCRQQGTQTSYMATQGPERPRRKLLIALKARPGTGLASL